MKYFYEIKDNDNLLEWNIANIVSYGNGPVEISGDSLRYDIVEWLDDNLSGEWGENSCQDMTYHIPPDTIYFEKEEDLVLFKLRWIS